MKSNKPVTTTALLARAAFPGTSGALTNGVIGVLEHTCTAITVAVAQVVLAVVRSSILTNPISTESTMSKGKWGWRAYFNWQGGCGSKGDHARDC